MNADAFRYLYNYHFSEYHKIWDSYILLLSQDQFTQQVGYSHGSIRNQVIHLINAENMWFSELSGAVVAEDLKPEELSNRDLIRTRWDETEKMVRSYLDGLRDDMLFSKPIVFEEDKDLMVWQVLLHVANHGTDHRAQLLRILHDFGLKTISQDFIFYVYDHM